jgi:predicted regulator of Ras-like GTPase activity (Roadblock/LC7/MglB family)
VIQAQDIIEGLVRKNSLRAAVLTDELGLPMAAFPSGVQSEAPAAMVVQIHRLFDRVHGQVGLRAMEEVTLRDDAGQQLVCRRIVTAEHDMILAVLVPPGRRHRQAIDQAVDQIVESWQLLGGS